MKGDDQTIKKITGSDKFVREDGTSFWKFLEDNGIAYSMSDFPFLTNHKTPRIKPVFDFEEFLVLESRGEAMTYLYEGLGRSFVYVGPVLDQELEHGFNDHTDRHTLWVSQTAVELMQRAGTDYSGKRFYDEKTEVLLTLVGLTHDLGNFVGRRRHSRYSIWLLDHLFINQDKHRSEWQAVMDTVLYHDERWVDQVGYDLKKGKPLLWGLVVADKMHVGRDRIGGRSLEMGEKGAFEADAHILLESMIVRSSWFIISREFVWHMDFSVEQLQEKFAAFTKGRDRLWVPDDFHDKFLKKGKKYRELFAEEWGKHYGDRDEMMAESVFLLFPHVNRCELHLVDGDVRRKVGSGEVVVWSAKKQGVPDQPEMGLHG